MLAPSTGRSLRRLLAVLAFSAWFGGLTFYAIVVIPTAHRVLGSHLRVGFITREVAHGINALAVGALLLLLWDFRGAPRSRLRRWTWAAMAAAQALLFGLHPVLDGHLDAEAGTLADAGRFYAVHRTYLIVTTFQWAAAVGHLWAVVTAWTGDRIEGGRRGVQGGEGDPA